MWFYRKMIRISQTQHVSNKEVSRRMPRKSTLNYDQKEIGEFSVNYGEESEHRKFDIGSGY